jgi:hypothetical protein
MSSDAISVRKSSRAVSGSVVTGSPAMRFFALIEGKEYEIRFPRIVLTSGFNGCEIEIKGPISLEALCAISNALF